MIELFEAGMVICFGISWPTSIIKSYTSRTSNGKSVFFLLFIFFGYLLGIAGKILTNNFSYVLIFYILNTVMVAVDIGLYFRNKKLDQKAGNENI